MAEADEPTRIDLNNMTRNLRHRTVIAKMCQYLKEVVQAGSANEPMVDRADYKRLQDYLNDIRALIQGLPVAGAAAQPAPQGRPEIDTPLTRDDFWLLQSPIEVPEMENVFWQEMCDRVRKNIREMKDSQSALFSNVWHPSDPPRWLQYIKAIEFDMQNLIGQIEPIDQPVTSPAAQPVFDTVGAPFDVEGASNNPKHPNAT